MSDQIYALYFEGALIGFCRVFTGPCGGQRKIKWIEPVNRIVSTKDLYRCTANPVSIVCHMKNDGTDASPDGFPAYWLLNQNIKPF